MGGYISSSVPPPTAGEALPAHNNNKGDVIVIPIDHSPHSEAAFQWYIQHLHRPENTVRLIHCYEFKINPKWTDIKAVTGTTTIAQELQQTKATAKLLIEQYEAQLQKYKIMGSVHTEFSTTPGEMVIDCVSRFRGDHVVMGSRGLGMVRRTILGSVSQYVIEHSIVPVTVIPPKSGSSKYF